jgi:hypothetical protein
MTICYKKAFKPLQRKNKEAYKFSETYPGHEFSHIIKSKHKTVPRIALPTKMVCPLKDLQLKSTKPNDEALKKYQVYAKMTPTDVLSFQIFGQPHH